MKQIYKFLGAVAVAAMAFTGCSNDIDEISTPDVNPEGLTLTLEVDANPANVTRTQMNDEGTNVIWSEQETVNFYGDQKFLKDGKVAQTMEGTKIHFTITLPSGTPAPKQLDGFFGAKYSGGASIKDQPQKYSAFGIILPASQDVTAKTFDPLADALVMDTKILEGVDLTQPISGISYNRLHAITKLMFKGADAYAQDKVSKIEFTVSSKDIAGEFAYDYTQKTFVDKAGAATSEPVFSFNPSKTITLKCADQPLLDAQFAAWMVMAAVELPQGEKVTVKVTTDKHIITKTLTIPAAAKFVSTKLNTLSVDLTGAQIEDLGAGQFSGDYVVMVYQESQNAYHAVKAEEDKKHRLLYGDILFTPGDKTVDPSSIDPSLIWTIGGNDQTGYTFTNASVNKSWTISTSSSNLPLGTPADSFTITKHEALNEKVQLPNYHITSAPNHYVGFNSSASFFAIYDNPGNFLLKDFYLVPVKADTRTALATPEGQAKATGNSIYVTWSEVANAQNYTVKCGAETYTTTDAKEVEHTFEGLKWATDYEITIIANADPASKEFKDSEAWKSTPVTTEPDPNPAFTLSHSNWTFVDTETGVDAAKDITVNITNNPQNLKIEAADTEHFTVVVAADNSKITVTPKAKVTADVVDEILTVKLGAATQEVKLTQKAFVEGAPQQMTIDLTTKVYGDGADVTTVVGTEPLSVVFAGAKYYDSGTAVRMYKNNTLTISGNKITKVQFGITTNSKGKKDLKCGGKTINAGCDWTWEDPNGVPEVVFTGTANHTGIQTITVFYK